MHAEKRRPAGAAAVCRRARSALAVCGVRVCVRRIRQLLLAPRRSSVTICKLIIIIFVRIPTKYVYIISVKISRIILNK